MAIYVYQTSSGVLVSWIPEEITIAEAQASGQLADSETLAAQGLEAVDGLPPLGPTVAWDETQKTTVTVVPPTPPNHLHTFDFIMAFTPAEWSGVRGSNDTRVQRFLHATQNSQGLDLNHDTIKTELQYFVNRGLLTQARANAILATTHSGAATGMTT